MRKLMQWCGCAVLAAGVGLAASVGQAAPMYAWVTEDGVYSYTDDLKKVPSRYRQQVQTLATRRLADYERLTESDSQATGRYAERLAARLGKLRALNAVSPPTPETRATPTPRTPIQHVSLSTGREDSPRVSLSTDSPEPVVIEPLFTRRPGDIVTRRATVVTQGDRTLAIVKGSRHHRSPSADVIDERDL